MAKQKIPAKKPAATAKKTMAAGAGGATPAVASAKKTIKKKR